MCIRDSECGVPCLAFDFGEAAKEEIIHGETGYLIVQNDVEAYKKAMAQIMIDEALRLKLGSASKEFAKQLDVYKRQCNGYAGIFIQMTDMNCI